MEEKLISEVGKVQYSNYNELYISINYEYISEKTGVKKGTVCYSDLAKSWGVVGHPEIDFICIDTPFDRGDTFISTNHKARKYNGMIISNLCIKNGCWCLSFDEYWS